MSVLRKAVQDGLMKLGGASSLTDGELLGRFVAQRDEVAFQELVRRHGPMVLRVCQRVLRHAQDSEDAFQATFIVLARKAGDVARMRSVGGWLHGVAYRVALKAQERGNRRQAHERQMADTAPEGKLTEPSRADLLDFRFILDEEVNRLPEKYRAAVVLHYLEGKTCEEVARHLRCQVCAVHKRLERARDRLRRRLERRGLALSACGLATLLAQETAAAALSGPLLAATVKAAASSAGATTATPAVLALAGEFLQQTAWKRLLVLALFLAVGVAGTVVYFSLPQSPALPPKLTLGGDALAHKGPVRSLTFSPDGATLASGGSDGTVKLWEVATGRLLQTLPAGNGEAGAMELAPDGQTLAVYEGSSGVGTVRVWDLKRTKERASFPAAVAKDSLCFSPDGQKLATAGWTGEVKLWDAATGKELAVLPWPGQAGTKGLCSLAFSPDGGTVIVASQLRGLVFWNVPQGKVTEEPRPLTIPTAISRDGRTVASAAYRTQKVRVFDVATLRERCSFQAAEGQEYVAFLALAPNGKKLITYTNSHTLKIWDVETGRSKDLSSRLGSVRQQRLTFSANGQKLVTARALAGGDPFTADAKIEVWDVEELFK